MYYLRKGILTNIVEHRKEGSLGFSMGFLGSLRRIIFPEIRGAFQTFCKTGDWDIIDKAREAGYRRAEEYAGRLLDLFREKRETTGRREAVEKELLKGLLP